MAFGIRLIFTACNKVVARQCFHKHVSRILSTGGLHGGRGGDVHGRGACMAGGGGMCGRGACMAGWHVWWRACMAGGMCGRGACMVGACVAGGMHGRGTCVAGGACMVGVCMAGGVHGRRNGNCSGRYASYGKKIVIEYIPISSYLSHFTCLDAVPLQHNSSSTICYAVLKCGLNTK